MQGYISYLLDYYSTFQKTQIVIDCKNELVAEKVADYLNVSQEDCKIKAKFDIYDKVLPIKNYSHYWELKFEAMEVMELEPEKDDAYFAAIFDLEGSFKVMENKKSVYPVVVFRKKELLDELAFFLGKKYTDQMTLQGKELLLTLDRLSDKLIARKNIAGLFINCLSDPDNGDYIRELEEYRL